MTNTCLNRTDITLDDDTIPHDNFINAYRISSLNMEVVVSVHAERTTTSEVETAPQAFKMLLRQTLQRQQQLQNNESTLNIPLVSVSIAQVNTNTRTAFSRKAQPQHW